MSQRPVVKLKLNTNGPPTESSITTPSTSTPKIKLKFGLSTPRTSTPPLNVPAAQYVTQENTSTPKSTKKAKKDRPPRLSQPTTKKRDYAAQSEDDEPVTAASTASKPQFKKVKLTTRAPPTPFIRMKAKGKPPVRPLGVGYDSEASDREIDPAIEEEFILRMAPGEDCDYLRKAVEEKKWGPRSEGGADVRMKFLTKDGRRAVVTIKGRHYAACLVDLPCVIEGMKSWDRRGWWKSADICQMLLVLGRVQREDEALDYELPGKELDKPTWQYAHGLTPPMRWVRKRRFRKRVSNRTIETMEEEVERLLRQDEESIGESVAVQIDLRGMSQEQSVGAESEKGGYGLMGNAGMQGESEYGEQDADGEADEGNEYFNEGDVEDDGLAAEVEKEMERVAEMEEADEVASTTNTAPATIIEGINDAITPATVSDVATPSKEDSGDDSSSDDEEDGAEEVDEDVLEQQQDLIRQREEIADLEAIIKSQTAEYDRQPNPILKGKLMKKIQGLRGDLEVKKAAIGEGGDD